MALGALRRFGKQAQAVLRLVATGGGLGTFLSERVEAAREIADFVVALQEARTAAHALTAQFLHLISQRRQRV